MNKDNTTDEIFSADPSVIKSVDVNSLLSSGYIEKDNNEFEMLGSRLLPHHTLDSVTPDTLVEILSMITKVTPDIVHGRNNSIVRVSTAYGCMIFTNQDEKASWSIKEPEQSIIIGVVYRFSQSSYIDPKIQAELNSTLLMGRVVVNDDNEVEYRTTLNFRGGRSAENALWEIAGFSKEATIIKMALIELMAE
jgi:hypothetical protein